MKGIILIAFALPLSGWSAHAALLRDFFSYADGPLTIATGSPWLHSDGLAQEVQVVSGRVLLTQSDQEDVKVELPDQPYEPQFDDVLYARMTINFTNGGSGGYFAHFIGGQTRQAYYGRIFSTGEGASIRIGIANSSNSPSVVYPTTLSRNMDHCVVIRYTLRNSQCTLWVNPTRESDQSITATDSAPEAIITDFGLRQSSGIGRLSIDNLIIGTTFTGVINPFRFCFISVTNQNVTLQWDTLETWSYRVDVSSNLVTWTPLVTNLVATGTTLVLRTNLQQNTRYFRVFRQP